MATTKKKAESSVKKPAAKRGRKPKNKISEEEFRILVQKKAYELFERRGAMHGNDFEDWVVAEKLVREELGLK